MHGGGKSDRLIVAEKRSNKEGGVPPLAESVERSGLTKGNSFQQNKYRTQQPEEEVTWRALNGHTARNRGNGQETEPTSVPRTCPVRWNGYGRLPAGISYYGSPQGELGAGRRLLWLRPSTTSVWPVLSSTEHPYPEQRLRVMT